MYVTIKTFDKLSKANFLKHRLELVNIDCELKSTENPEGEAKMFKIEVRQKDVEKAVDEILKVQKEYPNEDYEGIIDLDEMVRILIPIDFSERSVEACKFAIAMSEKVPVEMKLLHVWNDEHLDQIAVMRSQSVEEFKRIERGLLKQELDSKLETFSNKVQALIKEMGASNILFHFSVIEGIAKIQIANSIKRYQPQIALVAHNTKHDFKGRISQHLSAEIIDMALCPVMYIPVQAKFDGLEGIDIMYATNFDEHAETSLRKLVKLFSPFNLDLYCINIATADTEDERLLKMNSLIDTLNKGEHGTSRINGNVLVMSNLVKGLDTYMEEKEIDIVSFTSPEYSIWHKVFQPDNRRKMMLGGKMPMLIFKYKD